MRMDNSVTWRQYKRLKFPRTVPKYRQLIHKYLFGGESVYGTNRYDGVLLQYNRTERIGLVHAVSGPNRSALQTSNHIFIIRFIKEVDVDNDNSLVVQEYGNIRYIYALTTFGSIGTILVQDDSLTRPVVDVVDNYWLRKRFGLMKRFRDLQDDHETQRHIGFFSVATFPIYKNSNNLE